MTLAKASPVPLDEVWVRMYKDTTLTADPFHTNANIVSLTYDGWVWRIKYDAPVTWIDVSNSQISAIYLPKGAQDLTSIEDLPYLTTVIPSAEAVNIQGGMSNLPQLTTLWAKKYYVSYINHKSCPALANVYINIPGSGNLKFGQTALQRLFFRGSATFTNNYAPIELPTSAKIYVPDVAEFSAAAQWSSFSSQIVADTSKISYFVLHAKEYDYTFLFAVGQTLGSWRQDTRFCYQSSYTTFANPYPFIQINFTENNRPAPCIAFNDKSIQYWLTDGSGNKMQATDAIIPEGHYYYANM